jgi:hypothetical protein
MARKFNPPPNWPKPPEGFTPGPGWQPDPSWPPPPHGWQLWTEEPPRAGPKPSRGHGRWLWPLGAFILGAAVVGIGSAGGAGEAELTAASERATVAEARIAELEAKSADLERQVAAAQQASQTAKQNADKAKQNAEAAVASQKAALDARKAELDAREKKLTGLEAEIAANTIPGDGIFLVGQDIKPGQYRGNQAGGDCYWARLKGTSGSFEDLIANDNVSGPTVVTIRSSDKAFETVRCGEWRKIG